MIHTVIEQPKLFDDPRRRSLPVEVGDICENRHRGSSTSQAANRQVNKANDSRRILEIIKADGGSWLKECARQMGKERNQISGRFSFLKTAGYIVATGEIIEGCKCYRWSGKN